MKKLKLREINNSHKTIQLGRNMDKTQDSLNLKFMFLIYVSIRMSCKVSKKNREIKHLGEKLTCQQQPLFSGI